MSTSRPLRVFLCHASQDKPAVHMLYQRLSTEGWIDPWLDNEKLIPGQDWNYEIARAVRGADVILVCLSHSSVTKEGYVQREINMALDIAKEKPKGTIFVIPVKLEECEIPDDLIKWQWIDYFDDIKVSHRKILDALILRVKNIPDVAHLFESLKLGGDAEYKNSGKKHIPRCLRVFISYSSDNAEKAQSIYEDVNNKVWAVPWTRDINLPGTDPELESYRLTDAIRFADIVLVLFSEKYMNREGIHQKEIRQIRHSFMEKPEDAIYMVVVKADDVKELPGWLLDTSHFVDYWGTNKDRAWFQIESFLETRAIQLNIIPE